MMRMNRNVTAGLVGVVVIAILIVSMWILSPPSFPGSLMGAIGGMVGGVLGVMYMQRFQDERLTQIMNLSARNVFIILIVALPLAGAVMFLGAPGLYYAGSALFTMWIFALAIYYVSLLYYYRK